MRRSRFGSGEGPSSLLCAPLLAGLLLLPRQESSTDPPCPFDRVVSIEIASSDPVLEARGPSKRIPYASEFSGTLHVWTRVEGDLDTFLRIELAGGKVLGEDDDSGGKPTPYLKLEVEAGEKLSIVVAASQSGGTGQVELHLVAAPETETTRAEAEKAKRELAEIRKLREAGDMASARSRVQALVDRLRGLQDSCSSELLSSALWDCGFESHELAMLRATEQAWVPVLHHDLRTLPDEHLNLQCVRGNVAGTIAGLGDLAGARALQEKALQVLSRLLPEENLDLQTAMSNLANTIRQSGDLPGARSLFEKVLDVRERTLGEEDPALQTARLNLAALLQELGDPTTARALDEKVLSILEKTVPEEHPNLQMARLNLGVALVRLGDLAGARALFERVLAVREKTLPEDHPDLQSTRGNLAVTIHALGDFVGARALQERVLAVAEKTLPDDHAELQGARINLACTLGQLGDHVGARVLEEKVVAVFEKTLPDEHPDLQQARLNLGVTLSQLGDYRGARSLLEGVLAVGERTLPDDEPDLQLAREDLVFNAIRLRAREKDRHADDRSEGARTDEFQRPAADFVRSLARTAASIPLGGSRREATERASSLTDDLGRALLFSSRQGAFSGGAEIEREAFAASERLRCAGLAAARLEGLEHDERCLRLREKIQTASEELTALAQEGAGPEPFESARKRREDAERELLAVVHERAGGRDTGLAVDAASLSKKLGPKDALIAYRMYSRWEIGSEREAGERSTDCLCAFVLKSDGALARVELGSIDALEKAVADWRETLGAPLLRGRAAGEASDLESELDRRGAVLRRLVIDPLLPALGEATHLRIALDDALHLAPLDALPGVDGKGRLGDSYRIEERLTFRELLWTDEPIQAGHTMLALGCASFNAEPAAFGETDTEYLEVEKPTEAAPSGRGGAWDRGFAPLPYTGPEAHGVASLFQDAFDDARAVVLEKRKASRQAVAELAPKARFVHLATHGWFSKESIRSQDDRDASPGAGLSPRMSLEERVSGASPMILCGLALAGANLPADGLGRHPGLVSAEEISTWNLSNCELAVLSACDTNVGLRRAGQGVHSLQQALHMAGARSVITSLWKVPDEATKDLMLDFYRRLWVEKKPKWQALWEAKTKIRNEKDEAGKPKYSTRDWAAWVLTGDPN